MSSVLVTGAAGFVGSRLCQAFSTAGFEVTGLDRVPPRTRPTCERFWTCELLAAGPDVSCFATVVHLAALLPGKAALGDLFAVNVGGTSAVLRHLSKDSHLILFSTGLVYGDQPGPFGEHTRCRPRAPYAESKLAAEAVARAGCDARQARLTVLRPSIIYGTGAPAGMLLTSMMSALRKGETFPMTPGEQTRDFLHVDDVASAVVALAKQSIDGVFNLATGEGHTVKQVAAMVGELTGRADLLRPGQLRYRSDEVFDYRLDARAIRHALGWQPRISLRDGLARLWKELT